MAQLGALEIHQVRRTSAEKLFGSLMEAHHYLGYTRPVGEHLKYLIYAQGQPVAALAWSSAPRHLGARDRFIGWSAPQRRAQHSPAGLQYPLPDPALGEGAPLGQPFIEPGGAADRRRLASAL